MRRNKRNMSFKRTNHRKTMNTPHGGINKEMIAIRDENKDGYIVLKQDSLYKPLLIVFGIFIFVLVVIFPISIFDNLWPDGMRFFRTLVKWVSYSGAATMLPLPASPVDVDFVIGVSSGAFNDFHIIWLTALIVVSDTFFALVGYKFSRTLKKLFAGKTSEKDEKKTNDRFDRYGNFAMFLGAATPLPFTLMIYTAGALKLPKKGFVIAVVAGRTIKYALIVFIIKIFGEPALNYGTELINSLLSGNIGVAHYVIGLVLLALLTWAGIIVYKYIKSRNEEKQ